MMWDAFNNIREQGWRSGESNRLPPMWPKFRSWTLYHKWVEFGLVLYSAQRVFLRVLRFLPSTKTSIQLIPASCKLCSKVTHGPYSASQRRHSMLSVLPCWAALLLYLRWRLAWQLLLLLLFPRIDDNLNQIKNKFYKKRLDLIEKYIFSVSAISSKVLKDSICKT